MIEWSDQHQMIRDALRRFVEAEIAPQVEALEHGDMPPYEILRKMFRTFGLDQLARARFASQMQASRSEPQASEVHQGGSAANADDAPARADLDLALISRADDLLARAFPGSSPLRWPWSRVVASGGVRGGTLELRVTFVPPTGSAS